VKNEKSEARIFRRKSAMFDEQLQLLATLWAKSWVRSIALTLYYLAILFGLILIYGQGDFSTPPFVYQGF
jgi:hypothetical protein